MRLLNKSTFSLVFAVLLIAGIAFVGTDVWANTMSATWSVDLDENTADNQSGWTVTLTYATAPATLPTDASIAVDGGTDVGTVVDFKPTTTTEPAAVAGTTKVFTFNVQLADVSTNADITLSDHRRVTLTNSQNLASTSIYTPKLKSITAPKSARAGTFEATIEFEPPADAVAEVTGANPVAAVPGIGPATGLKATDIAASASASVLSVMDNGDNTYTVQAVLVNATTDITLATTFLHQEAPDGDDTGTDNDAENRARVIYDDERPTIGPIVFKSLTNRDLDISSVTGAFDVFIDHIDATVASPKSINDEPDTVSNEEMFPLVVEFMVEPADRGATVSNVGRIDGKPAATITPKENTTSTNWPATNLTLTVKVTDGAGNFAVKRAQFTVAPRAATTTGPVDPVSDTDKPTVVSVTAPTTPIAAGQPNAGSLVFTIMFSEPLKAGTFTIDDLVITNVDTQTAHSMLVMDTTDTTGKTYKLTVTPTDDTFPVKVSFNAEATVTDRANPGNVSEKGIDKEATYTPKGVLGVDIKPPDKPLNGSLVFTFEFAQAPVDAMVKNPTTGEVIGEDIRGFAIGDVDASNARPLDKSDLRKSVSDDKVYYLTVTPVNSRLAVTVTLYADAVVADPTPEDTTNDDALIAGQVSATFTPDITAPTLEITHTPADSVAVSSGGMVTFTFTFTDENTIETSGAGAFTTNDVAVVGGMKGTFTATNNKTYTLMVTPTTPNTNVTVTVAAGSVTDTAIPPNALAASVSETWTAPTIADTTAPTLAITHTPADSVAVGSGGMVTFTFTFTDDNMIATSGAGAFTTDDVAVVGGMKGTFTATNNKTYTLMVTPTTSYTNVTVTVAAGSVTDTATTPNALAASVSETWTAPSAPPIVDRTPPTLTITNSPLDGEALPTNGHVMFTFRFTELLGAGTHAFTVGDIAIQNGNLVEFTGSGTVYILTVMSTNRALPVTVTVAAGAVADPTGNLLAAAVSESYNPIDNQPPTVTITSAMGTGVNAGKIVFTFTFSEPLGMGDYAFTLDDIDRANSNATFATQPEKVMGTSAPAAPQVAYTLAVTPRPADADPVIIILKTLSVADASGNMLVGDQVGTYSKPVITPESDIPVVTISGPSYIDSVDGGMVTITATDNTAVTNAVMDAEITVTNATKGNISNNQIQVMPNTGAISVTVTVAAGAAMDAAGNRSDAKSMTFKVGPTFTIPTNTILVITKTYGMTYRYLSDQPRLPVTETPPVPVSNIRTAVWQNMPDLEVLFSLTGGGNGGTINLTEALGQAELPQTRDGDKNQKNSVRISEVMWASDLYLRGAQDDREAAEQWIEITNDTSGPVEIFLFARTGLDSAINVDNVEDRVGNAYNGSPGSAGWAVPGQNGNSWTGVNFVSMHRKYVTGDNRGYVRGTESGNWSASDREYLTQSANNPYNRVLYNYVGSPGRPHSIGLPRPSTRAGVTQVPSSPFIINEVANRDSGNADYEWIEIKNVTNERQNLRNYLISMVTKVGDADPTDVVLLEIDNKDYWVEGGDVILLLASDPRYDDDHPIAVGYNVDVNANDQVDGLGLNNPDGNRKPPLQKVTSFKNGGLPDGGDYILILRKPDNYEGHRSGAHGGKGVAETSNFGSNPIDVDKIVDIAGSHRGLNKSNYPATNPSGLNSTTLWPLVNFNEDMRPHYGHGDLNHRRHNRLDVNRVRYRQHVMTKAKNDADGATPGYRAGTGVTHKDEGVQHYAFRDAIYTGLGYKRTARAPSIYNGTPGYDGNSVGNTGIVKATAADADVTISEIMYSTGPNPDNPILPQWVELYNSSPTNAVNLRNWKLRFETLDADGNPMDSLMDLNFNNSRSVKTIQPQQTVLIVAGNARQANSDSATGIDVFNENRVFNVYRDVGAGKFGANTRYMFFNPTAFNISVVDKDNKVVDAIGNLDGDSRTSDTANWDFPAGIANGNRTSIIRIYDDGVARNGVNTAESHVQPIFKKGGKPTSGNDIDAKYSWIPAVNTERDFKITIKSTWYGDEDDYGTPGHRLGLVLPVELSSFRPTLEDGIVTIRWTTESELDNAGFNIYRSEERDGEFKQVNSDLIEGAGTTGERSNYSWVDQTAKPGVIYYYQIEDVSFAGEREPLMITKLKGLISAKNKLTTTWSELKEASQ